MRNAKIICILITKTFFLGFILFFSTNIYGQNLPPEEIEKSVVKIAGFVEDNYVFAEKGKKIAANFLNEHKQGKFVRAKNWQEFSSIATDSLRRISGDGHLYVHYDPEEVKELTAPAAENDNTNSNQEDTFFHGEKAREKNYGFSEIKVLDGNIGYLRLSEINISEKSLPTLFAAIRFVSGTKSLIIDVRDNSGGGSEIGPVLESFFLPKNVLLLEFRNRNGMLSASTTVAWLTERKYERPVYIVVNKKTASAAEAFAYALQAKKRVTVVGQPSAGGAHMSSWYAVNDQIYVSVSTGAPVLPGTETSWESKGIQPDLVTKVGEEIEFIRRKISESKKE